MLAAAHRLHRSADFARALRQGRRCARSALVVHLSVPMRVASAVDGPALDGPALDEPAADEPAAEQAAPTRAGFVVSRAVGGAVVRNAVTRRLRALVRERLDRVPPGSLLVVRALPAAAVTPFAELGAQLDACLDRLTGGLGSEVSP